MRGEDCATVAGSVNGRSHDERDEHHRVAKGAGHRLEIGSKTADASYRESKREKQNGRDHLVSS